MNNKTYILLTALIFLLPTFDGKAQSWVVGQPVDEPIATLEMGAFGCYPDADHHFTFPTSEAEGVQHILFITEATPEDSVVINPKGVVNTGDTIWISETQDWQVYFKGGAGSAKLEFRAIGTPINAGDNVPCQASDLWISDLLLCNEGLQPVLNVTCKVDGTNGIHETEHGRVELLLPSVENDYQLSIQARQGLQSLQVFDMQGKLLASTASNTLNCSTFPKGIYVAVLKLDSGQMISEKFLKP